VALSRAEIEWLFPDAGALALVAPALNGPALLAGLRAAPLGLRFRTSVTWLPELKPVETDHNGRCQECGAQARSSRHGKLANARKQIQCLVAAAARRSRRHMPPATARTATLLSQASKNSAVNAEFCK
jgi:hypothetical protein